jgi:hypothetical protein
VTWLCTLHERFSVFHSTSSSSTSVVITVVIIIMQQSKLPKKGWKDWFFANTISISICPPVMFGDTITLFDILSHSSNTLRVKPLNRLNFLFVVVPLLHSLT